MKGSASTIRAAVGAPASDETLSSVVDRIAGFWEVDRSSILTSTVVDGKDEDLDAPSAGTLAVLASITGFAEPTFDAIALEDSIDLLLTQHRFGYCPRCWEDDRAQGREPYFRQSWAFISALSCMHHGTLLYAWITNSRGQRRPAPSLVMSRRSDEIWEGDLAHAKKKVDRDILQPLVALAEKAASALTWGTPWPKSWRGNPEAGKTLVALLATNPTSYLSSLPMDRLLPVGPDDRWFARHRWSVAPSSAEKAAHPLRDIGDPAIRRTLWWGIGRTIVPGWKPLRLFGQFAAYDDVNMWWALDVAESISDQSAEAYRNLSNTLGFSRVRS